MACFLVSAAEAVVVGVVKKAEKKHEEKLIESGEQVVQNKVPLSRKLSWLFYMLIGGAVLLMFEHVWHGEVVPWFPFLSAINDPEETTQMLHEMATVGTTMAGLITVIWIGMCLVADRIVKRQNDASENEA